MTKTQPKRNKKYVPRETVKSELVSRKQFDYSLGDIKLNFNLRVDIKKELQGFKQLMEKAIKDIDSDLANLSK